MGKHERPEKEDGLAEWERELLNEQAEAAANPFLASLRQMSRDMDAAEMWGAGFVAGYRMARGL